MLNAAIILFALAAILGVINLAAILKNKATPKTAVFLHGIVAAIALILVIVYTVSGHASSPLTALVLFVIVAIVGFIMFGIDLAKKPVPKFLAVIHPIVAVIALILLIVFTAAPVQP